MEKQPEYRVTKEEYEEITKKKLMDRHRLNFKKNPMVKHSACLFPVLALTAMATAFGIYTAVKQLIGNNTIQMRHKVRHYEGPLISAERNKVWEQVPVQTLIDVDTAETKLAQHLWKFIRIKNEEMPGEPKTR